MHKFCFTFKHWKYIFIHSFEIWRKRPLIYFYFFLFKNYTFLCIKSADEKHPQFYLLEFSVNLLVLPAVCFCHHNILTWALPGSSFTLIKGTVSEISSDPLYKDVNARFAIISLNVEINVIFLGIKVQASDNFFFLQ